jgi:beta-xylosidase
MNHEHTRRSTRGLWLLLCVLGFSLNVAAQRRATYANPTVAGDFPDPSVTRVGQDFWGAATSSEWGPEFPILHSRDLVNWEVVGMVGRQLLGPGNLARPRPVLHLLRRAQA